MAHLSTSTDHRLIRPSEQYLEPYSAVFDEIQSVVNQSNDEDLKSKYFDIKRDYAGHDWITNTKACQKALFVLTHEIAQNRLAHHQLQASENEQKKVLRVFAETLHSTIEQSENKVTSLQLYDRAIKEYRENGNERIPGLLIQEIPVQRYFLDALQTMEEDLAPKFVKLQLNTLVRSIQEKTLMANLIDQYNEDAHEICPIDPDSINEASYRKTLYNAVSLEAKFKLHVWAVIVFAEALWRTLIESVAYAIHLMAPSWFGGYEVEDRKKMFDRQVESLGALGYAIVSPGDALDGLIVSFSQEQDHSKGYALDSLDKTGRGTVYLGRQISGSCFTSDHWQEI